MTERHSRIRSRRMRVLGDGCLTDPNCSHWPPTWPSACSNFAARRSWTAIPGRFCSKGRRRQRWSGRCSSRACLRSVFRLPTTPASPVPWSGPAIRSWTSSARASCRDFSTWWTIPLARTTNRLPCSAATPSTTRALPPSRPPSSSAGFSRPCCRREIRYRGCQQATDTGAEPGRHRQTCSWSRGRDWRRRSCAANCSAWWKSGNSNSASSSAAWAIPPVGSPEIAGRVLRLARANLQRYRERPRTKCLRTAARNWSARSCWRACESPTSATSWPRLRPASCIRHGFSREAARRSGSQG